MKEKTDDSNNSNQRHEHGTTKKMKSSRRKSKKQIVKKKHRHADLKRRKHHNQETSSSSSSSSSSASEASYRRKRRKRHKTSKEKDDLHSICKVKGEGRPPPNPSPCKEEANCLIAPHTAAIAAVTEHTDEVRKTSLNQMTTDPRRGKAQRMVPMSKEQYEAMQSQVRGVFDEETGRYRLVRGDGEIIERIVSKSDHQRINQLATRGDGSSFARKIHGKAFQSR
jgi:hypothetical protein